MSLHTTDLDGAFVAGREEIVRQMRLFGTEWVDGVYAESRTVADEFDALEFLRTSGKVFSVMVLGEDPEIAFNPDKADDRIYRPSYLLFFVQRFSDGDGEDDFLTRVERACLRLAGQLSIMVTLAAIVVEFAVTTLESVLACTVLSNEAGEILGHAAIRRVVLEVTACAA